MLVRNTHYKLNNHLANINYTSLSCSFHVLGTQHYKLGERNQGRALVIMVNVCQKKHYTELTPFLLLLHLLVDLSIIMDILNSGNLPYNELTPPYDAYHIQIATTCKYIRYHIQMYFPPHKRKKREICTSLLLVYFTVTCLCVFHFMNFARVVAMFCTTACR